MLDWLARELRVAAIDVVERLPASTCATVHVVRTRGVASRDLVVKRYDRGIPVVDGPGFVAGDIAGLTAAAQAGLPAPRLVAADPTGESTGAATIVMTRVPGRCQPAPSEGDADVWLEQLAEVLVRIHAAPQPSVDLPRFRSWHEPSVIAPAWIRDGGIARAFAARVADGFSGADGPRFIHRDYHPLNVLFDGACISGVVDWVNACVGPIETDIARCRGNIALVAGMGAADRFLRLLGPVGATYDRAWDLDFVASLLGNVDVLLTGNDLGLAMSPRAVRDTLETIVRGALI